ncbi:MAG: hypothetical protein CL866_04625 [Cycloclasticus sp.]|nr:hypothetical protein [Cycloclasticus sp.]MBG96141.1 hypothetical protein [Cycloclasticus sp.]|tara:strand:- start:1013 stop:1243 length:231 start_codon:yes stop_codon:yes gene_type:complete
MAAINELLSIDSYSYKSRLRAEDIIESSDTDMPSIIERRKYIKQWSSLYATEQTATEGGFVKNIFSTGRYRVSYLC